MYSGDSTLIVNRLILSSSTLIGHSSWQQVIITLIDLGLSFRELLIAFIHDSRECRDDFERITWDSNEDHCPTGLVLLINYVHLDSQFELACKEHLNRKEIRREKHPISALEFLGNSMVLVMLEQGFAYLKD